MSIAPMVADAPEGPEDSVEEALQRAPLFRDLPPVVLKRLRESSERRHYEAGQTVFSLGQYDGSEFFVILSGLLRLNIVHADSGEMVIEDFEARSIFGLEAALCEESEDICRSLAVSAHQDLEVLALDMDSFRKLAGARPSLMRNIAGYLARETVSLRYKTPPAKAAPEQRVFAALLDFVEHEPSSGAWRIERMPKHRELAEIAGVDEPLAAGAVASLIQGGVAQRDYPGLIINDIRRLNELSGQR